MDNGATNFELLILKSIFYTLITKHERSAIAIGSGSSIAIWSKDRGVIGVCKIKDRDRKNAIYLAIVALCTKYEVKLQEI